MKRYLVPVAVVAALFANGAMAQAIDTKIYSGSACNPMRGADQGKLKSDSVGVTNVNGSNVANVTCPLVRDQLDGFVHPLVWTTDVRVHNPGSDTLSCRMFARTVFGTAPLSGMWKSDFIDFPGDTILNTSLSLTSFAGAYAMECKLPPGGIIYGYRNTEVVGIE